MTVNAAYQAQPPTTSGSPASAYAQPAPGITEQVVTLADENGVSLTGAAGTASVAVLSVQGIAGGTALPVSGSGLGGGVAQASTTSGQLGTLVQGAVTTAAPTYVNAQTDPLSLTTAGSLRTVDNATVAQGSTTASQVGPLVQGAVTTGAPTYTTAQTNALSLTTTGMLRTFDVLYRDTTVTAQAGATSTAPSAGAVIATVTPGTAGVWEVYGTVSVTGTSVIVAESNNMGLYQTAAAVLAPIPMPCTTAGSGQNVPFGPILLSLSGADTVNVKAIGNATAVTPVYAASIVARRVS